MANSKSKGGRKRAAPQANGAAPEHTEGLIAQGGAVSGGGLPAATDGLLAALPKGQRRSLQAQWNRFVRASDDMSAALRQLGTLAFGEPATAGPTMRAKTGAGQDMAQSQAASG